MMTNRQLFLQHVAQTSDAPLALEIVKAAGVKMWDKDGKAYLDVISGVSVCNIGHSHPEVVKAVQQQVEKYMHLIVYGEFIESPQVQYAKTLTDALPETLNSVYFTNSGAEAVEGAMKLAKRYTGRPGIVAFKNSYHGSTQGALSMLGDEYWRNAYRPLLPDVAHIRYNNYDDLELITRRTAAVFVETIQAEAGVIVPEKKWLQSLREQCTATGALLIMDEIQCGMGRNGSLWAFEQFDVVPDVLLLAKSLGGGMPLGAFIADRAVMQSFTARPELGHITTFGGHPVSCTAGLAAFEVMRRETLVDTVFDKEQHFINGLKHPAIKAVRSRGLMMAVELASFEINQKVIKTCIANGLISDWFLFAPQCLRLAPPLTISGEEIDKACAIIVDAVAQNS